MLRALGLLRGIFDRDTRRKAVAVVGAAMELRVRLGVERAAKSVAVLSGERVLDEMDTRRRTNFAAWMWLEIGDRVAIFQLRRRVGEDVAGHVSERFRWR
jgi:hypothetical protein